MTTRPHNVQGSDRKRRQRMPFLLAILLAALVGFVIVFVIAGFVVPLVISLIGLHAPILVPLVILFAIPIAFYVFRHVFSYFRWKWVLELGPSCLNCDYDLTGNVSGVCPECGTPIANTVDSVESGSV